MQILPGLNMTKLFSIVILYKGEPGAHILKAGHDLTSISYFQRSTAENFIMFTSKILVERTGVGARQSVKEAEYMCHVFVRSVVIQMSAGTTRFLIQTPINVLLLN